MIRIILACFLLTLSAFASENIKAYESIKDNLVENTLSKNYKIPDKKVYHFKDTPLKQGVYTMPHFKKVIYADNLVNATLKGKNLKIPAPNIYYDYSDDRHAVIKIKPVSLIKADNKLKDGDIVKFKTVEDVTYEGKLLLKKDAQITAVVENVTANDFMGIPSNIVISRFKNSAIDEKAFDYTLSRQGANRAVWVYPLYYLLTPFFGMGLPFAFVKGGNAKIKPNEIIEIYYRPTRFKKAL